MRILKALFIFQQSQQKKSGFIANFNVEGAAWFLVAKFKKFCNPRVQHQPFYCSPKFSLSHLVGNCRWHSGSCGFLARGSDYRGLFGAMFVLLAACSGGCLTGIGHLTEFFIGISSLYFSSSSLSFNEPLEKK